MRSKVFVGIDVGFNGGIVAINEDTTIVEQHCIPKDITELYQPFSTISDNYDEIHCWVEDVHSIYGMSAKSNFRFGWIKGAKETLARDYFGVCNLVTPKVWQKDIWRDEDVVLNSKGGKDTKATSLKAAERLWPGHDFTRSARATKPHDGLVDAALIALYGYITYYPR